MALFELGRIVATPGCLAAFESTMQNVGDFITRHVNGDWGEVCAHDAAENELARREGFRIMSVYSLNDGTKIWIITEADRSSTCLLLPDEY